MHLYWECPLSRTTSKKQTNSQPRIMHVRNLEMTVQQAKRSHMASLHPIAIHLCKCNDDSGNPEGWDRYVSKEIKSVMYADWFVIFRNTLRLHYVYSLHSPLSDTSPVLLRLHYTMSMYNLFDVDNTCTWTNLCRCTNCRLI